MQLLLLVTTYEVGRFVQIAGLISLPIIIITLSLIAWLHYRKKQGEDPASELAAANAVYWIETPAESAALKVNGPFPHNDAAILLFNTTRKLHAQHHMYEALHERYRKLQYEHDVMQMSNEKTLIRYNQLREEKMMQQQLQSGQSDTLLNLQQQLDEKEAELDEMETMIIDLQQRLTEIEGDPAIVGEPAISGNTQHNQYHMDNITTEQRYLQDMLNEKQAQIEFLQRQLDQRVRGYHEMEAAHRQMETAHREMETANREMETTHREMTVRLESLEAQLQQKESVLKSIQELLGMNAQQQDNTVIKLAAI